MSSVSEFVYSNPFTYLVFSVQNCAACNALKQHLDENPYYQGLYLSYDCTNCKPEFRKYLEDKNIIEQGAKFYYPIVLLDNILIEVSELKSLAPNLVSRISYPVSDKSLE